MQELTKKRLTFNSHENEWKVKYDLTKNVNLTLPFVCLLRMFQNDKNTIKKKLESNWILIYDREKTQKRWFIATMVQTKRPHMATEGYTRQFNGTEDSP